MQKKQHREFREKHNKKIQSYRKEDKLTLAIFLRPRNLFLLFVVAGILGAILRKFLESTIPFFKEHEILLIMHSLHPILALVFYYIRFSSKAYRRNEKYLIEKGLL